MTPRRLSRAEELLIYLPNPLDPEATLEYMRLAMNVYQPGIAFGRGWECYEAASEHQRPLSAEIFFIIALAAPLSRQARGITSLALSEAKNCDDYEQVRREVWTSKRVGNLVLRYAEHGHSLAPTLIPVVGELLLENNPQEHLVLLDFFRGRMEEILGNREQALRHLLQAERAWKSSENRDETALFTCRLYLIILATQLKRPVIVEEVSLRIRRSSYPMTSRQVRVIRAVRKWGRLGLWWVR